MISELFGECKASIFALDAQVRNIRQNLLVKNIFQIQLIC